MATEDSPTGSRPPVKRPPPKGRQVGVAATAWHQGLWCERVDPGELSRFIDDHRNKGPERIPH